VSFRLKTILGIALIEALLLGILIVSSHLYLVRTNETQLADRTRAMAQMLATSVADSVVAMDLATLDSLIGHALENHDVAYIRVRNQAGLVLAEGGDADALEQAFLDERQGSDVDDDGRLDFAQPILAGGAVFGRVELGLSTVSVRAAISESFVWSITVALIEIGLVAVFGFILGTILTRQLADLRLAARRLQAGELGHQLAVRGRDELAETAHCFNRMSAELARNRDELETHRSRLEDLVAARTAELAAQTAKLEEALEAEKTLNQLQRSFVSMVSHEFRTPLAIIDGAIGRLKRRADRLGAADVEQASERVSRSVRRMTELIERTLTAARMDAGEIKIEPGDCDLGALVRACCDRQQEIAPNHRIEFHLDHLPPVIRADSAALDQVLTNLLSNAVKYAPDAPLIEVRAWQEDALVKVSVRDRGLRIEADDLPKMFRRFFRAGTSAGIVGTGIGLHLVKLLLTRHGGDIDLESRLGEGTTFTLHLPVAGPPPAPAAEGTDAAGDPRHRTLSGRQAAAALG
jgi:signal transduction histidine kinase